MTAVARRERTDAAVARLAAEHEAFATSAPRAPRWLKALRERGIQRFAEVGFPTTKDERWRFTSVETIARQEFVAPGDAPSSAATAVEQLAVGAQADRCVAVFVNGRFAKKLSTLSGLPAGVTVGSLAAAMKSHGTLVERHLGAYADVNANPFTALNAAFVTDGAFVHVPRNTVLDRPIQLVFVAGADGNPVASHVRNVLVFEDGAQASLVEQYVGAGQGSCWTNVVTEIAIGENAVVDAYRIQREPEDGYHTATSQSRQGRGSVYTATTFAFGSRLSRHDIAATLDGEGAECTLNGLSILRGEQHVDHHTTLEHAQPHCPSWEVFNGIYDDKSRGVFNGRIIVRPGAQKTDSKQTSNNLLLSAEARADSQPQLEIYADDVKCTHGATLGPVDPRALFYLRSRGLDAEQARNLLTFGFAAQILNAVALEDLRAWLDEVVRGRLDEGARKRSRA
jgi:Fe-S cluster assembly protein SufD